VTGAYPNGFNVTCSDLPKRLELKHSLHSMLQILSVTPFEKVPLVQLLTDIAPVEETLVHDKQLILF